LDSGTILEKIQPGGLQPEKIGWHPIGVHAWKRIEAESGFQSGYESSVDSLENKQGSKAPKEKAESSNLA
jgi:hypothetical protein